jgi:hypothetical protein
MHPNLPHFILCLMLLWAVVPINPYGYYTLIKIILFTYTAYLAYKHLSRDPSRAAGWFATGIALTYNPIVSLHLGRPLWTVVNLATIAILLLLIPPINQQK